MQRKDFKHSEESKQKISAGNKGKKRSEETKRKIGEAIKGENHPRWKGGRIKASNGYILVYSPDHPYVHFNGYVLEHRLVMEAHLGRTLLPTEVVHHINDIKDDNRIENLMLFSSKSEHVSFHRN